MQLRTHVTWSFHTETLRKALDFLEPLLQSEPSIARKNPLAKTDFETTEYAHVLEDAREALSELEAVLKSLKPIVK